ncbi:MAG: hypothetical protein U1G05_00575 [Kiritimatiellia bacterium]
MHHPALALLTREVRLTLRGRTLLLVLLAVGILLFFAGPAMLANSRAGAAGRGFLLFAANLQIVLITLMTAVLVAGAVSEEKESGAIDLLLMTGMSPFSLLAGLAGGRVVALLAALAAQLPFLVLGITAGGVLPGQVMASFAVLTSHAVLCTGLALWLALETRTHAMALAGMLAVILGVANVAAFLGVRGMSAFAVLDGVFENPAGFTFPASWCLKCLALGAACFAAACLRFRTCAIAGDLSTRVLPAALRRPRARPYAGNAVYWKDRHFLHGGLTGVVARAGVPMLAGLGAAIQAARLGGGPDEIPRMVGAAVMGLAYALFWLELVFHSARMFRTDRQEGTVDDLLGLPVAANKVMNQKESALALSLAPYVVLWVLGLALADPRELPGTLALTLPGLMLAYVLHLIISEQSLSVGWWSIPLGIITLGGIGFLCMVLSGFILLVTLGMGGIIVFPVLLFLYVRLVIGLRKSLARKFLTPPDTRWASGRLDGRPWRRCGCGENRGRRKGSCTRPPKPGSCRASTRRNPMSCSRDSLANPPPPLPPRQLPP